MKSRIFFAVFALFMSIAAVADAQPRGRHNNHDRNGYNDYDRGYHNGRGHYGNNGYYQNRGGYGNGNCNNGYGRGRRMYRRPVSYCAPAPVVYAAPPRYYAPRPVMYGGRPRVNINIGF
ncbi:MAG: hypothetical protein JNL13_11715 [Chitinophagaceae bacterium]|nr:hypothetical protein [Chitinophagaceae bacterium]